LIDERTSKVVIHRDVIFNEFGFNKDFTMNRSVNYFDNDVVSEEETVVQPPDVQGSLHTGILEGRDFNQSGMALMIWHV